MYPITVVFHERREIMSEAVAVNERTVFYTKNITSIPDINDRVKRHFILLNRMESCMFDDYTIAHKGVYVKTDDDKIFLMDFSLLYLNCVLWLFNISFNEPIRSDDLYDLTESTKGKFTHIMNEIISKFIKLGYDLDNINIGTIKEKLIQISTFYGEIYSNTFSLYDVMAFESRCPEFSKLYNTILDVNLSSNELESYLTSATDKFYKLIIDDKQNNLYPFMSTGMVKRLQIEQMFMGVGTRQDIDKSILPVIIKRGWMHGMSSISEFYVEAVSTRSSIIVKKEAVPDSGYLSRKVNIACLGTHIDSNIYDCGTKHYLSMTIGDESHLKLLEGKYMLINENGPILQDIGVNDVHLIGQTVKIRSHTKCITGHKIGKVCCICVGNKHKTLKNARIGGLVSIKLINPITQLGMSAKHASTTKSEEIGGEVINQYFVVSRSNIYPKKNVKGQLLIKLELVNDIRTSEITSENYGYENGLDYSKNIDMILVAEDGYLRGVDIEDKSFFVNISKELTRVISNQSMDIVRIEDITSNVFIDSSNDNDWQSELQGNEYVAINLSELDIADPIFTTKILTEEVSKHLKNTKLIIDGSKTSTYTNPEDIINEFVEILYKANLRTAGSFIHIETLVMNLMRSYDDVMARADFSSDVHPEIRFIKLTQAIQKSDLFSTLCFQDISRQLEMTDTLRKNRSGIFDVFFKNSEYIRNGIKFEKTRPYLFNK